MERKRYRLRTKTTFLSLHLIFSVRLEEDLARDIRFGSTASGPHHDDLAMWINGADVRVYGSQGQQRTTALSMKLAELSMMKEETKYSPVLLLDDVMSELDQERQWHLAQYIQENQNDFDLYGY